jgi:hypothetical protein
LAFLKFSAAVLVSALFLSVPAAHALRIDASVKNEYTQAVDVLKIQDMRDAIQKIWSHGLNPKTYWTDSMEQSFQAGQNVKDRANQNFVRLLQDISSGTIDPSELTADIAVKPKGFMNAKQLQALITSTGQQAELLVETIAPQNPPYMA